jgi:hypothetical protein
VRPLRIPYLGPNLPGRSSKPRPCSLFPTDAAASQSPKPAQTGASASRRRNAACSFSGSWASITRAALLDKPREIVFRERLATVKLNGEFRDLRLYGAQNPAVDGVPVKKQPDGAYAAEIATTERELHYVFASASRNGLPIRGTD